MNEQIENTPLEGEAPAAESAAPTEQEAVLRQEILSHPLMLEAMALLENSRFEQDLAAVRAVYPQLEARHPQEVGEIYCRLMAAGEVDPVVAYEAQLAADRRREPKPAEMVPAAATGGAAAYFSSRELDRLSAEDLKDPGIFRKAMHSLSKLKK